MNSSNASASSPDISATFTLALSATSGAAGDGIARNSVTATLMSGSTYVSGQRLILSVTAGSALFSSSGTNTVTVTTNSLGAASVQLTDKVDETVTIKAFLTEDPSVNASTSSTFGNNDGTLPAPSVAEAENTAMTIDPKDVTEGITVIIPMAANLATGDTASASVKTVNGTITTAGHTVTTAEAGKPLSLTVEETLTNVADGDAVTVWYTVTRVGSTAKDSDVAGYTVSVTAINLRVMGSRSNLSCYYLGGGISTLVALDADTLTLTEATWWYDGDSQTDGITTQYFRDTAPHRLLHVSAGGEAVTLNRINVARSLSSVAARTDAGRVLAWGGSDNGGTVPDAVAGLTDIVSVFGGGRAFAALRSNGSVVAWGNSNAGGTVPAAVAGLTDIVSVSGVDGAFAALRSNGSVVAWGGGYGGTVPAAVAGLTDIVSVAGGQAAFAALRSKGSVVAWGDGWSGGAIPAAVAGLTDIVSVFVGDGAFAALCSNGSVVAWGGGYGGTVPVAVACLTDIVSVAGGGGAFAALRSNGSVVAWGKSEYGGTIPAAVAGLTDIVSVTGGGEAFAALRSNGSVVVWGYLGARRTVPAAVSGGAAFESRSSNGSVGTWPLSILSAEDYPDVGPLSYQAVYIGYHVFAGLTDSHLAIWGKYSGSADGISYEVHEG